MLEQSPKQQTVELINQAKSILVVSHKNPDGDALGCLCALKIALSRLGKKVTIAAPDEATQVFAFLPQVKELKTKVEASRDFVISLNVAKAEIEKIGYKKDETKDRVNIVIVPRNGQFEPSDVEVKKAGPIYDLIIAVDTPNFERLGNLAVPADLFYEVPVVNIDHHPSNERYGKVNWVELVATSTAEILVSLFEAISHDTTLINEEVATALLTGLIYDTSSFQNMNTTPKSLTVAAQLVAAGAHQQEIVKNLYKTKSLETLKLWGLILSNVIEDKENKFLWSAVTKEEINKVGADESALSGVVDELLKTATDVDFALLLSEREGQIHGSFRSIIKGVNVAELAELFSGGGHEVAAAFRIDGNLKESQEEILQKIRQFQNKAHPEEVSSSAKTVEKAPEKEVVQESAEEIKETKKETPLATDPLEDEVAEAPNKTEIAPKPMGDAFDDDFAKPGDDINGTPPDIMPEQETSREKTKW